MELVTIKCIISDGIGITDMLRNLCSSVSEWDEDFMLYNKTIMTFSHHVQVT